MDQHIEWSQAQELAKQLQERQQKAVSSFLEEDCEMANGRDLDYWKNKTGKSVSWILENGQNIHPALIEVVRMSADHSDNYTFDDVWDFEPPIANDNDWEWEEEDEIEFYLDEQHKLFQ